MRYLSLLIVLGCGSTPSEVPPDPTPTGDTGTPSPASSTTTESTSQVGNISYWRSESPQGSTSSVYALFASSFDASPVPAPCGMGGHLCTAALPETIGETLTFEPASLDDSTTQFVWLGNTITLGELNLQFQVDEQTGVGGYARENIPPNTGALSLQTEGQWGSFEMEDAVAPADPLVLVDIEPNAYLEFEGDPIVLTWEPAANSEMYVEIRQGDVLHEITRVDDNGQYAVPAATLEQVTAGNVAEITLLRRKFVRDIDIGGNVVTVDTWTETQVFSGIQGLASCKEHRDQDPTQPSSTYFIQPNPTQPGRMVWCDMSTDGGGWTLVGSTDGTTFDDSASGYYNDLQTTNPVGGHTGIWDGMRPLTAAGSDIRFTCKTSSGGAPMAVDLSFYNNSWYQIITTGTDTQSCFNDSNGSGATPPPGRRNNLTGTVLVAGDQWGAGYLEGEDSCSDSGDFTVDFDDRGMDSDQSDGTDWGEDDNTEKCGTSGSGAQWFIWVREL